MEKTSKRNGTIELLRFVCCVFIVLTHAKHLFPDEVLEQITIRPIRGALGVEFFFLVSGYLMACSAAKYLQSHKDNIMIGTATTDFIKRKIMALMPTLLVAFALSFIVAEISKLHFAPDVIAKDFMQNIWNLLLVEVSGFGSITELWYISAMILVMWVLYPFCLKNFDYFTRIIAPLLAIFLLGFIVKTQGSLLNPGKYLEFSYKCLPRAFAEIALGTATYPVIEWLKNKDIKKSTSIFLSVVQLLCWAVVIYIMLFFHDGDYDEFALLLILISVVISFSHKSALADLMDNKISYFLGKLSLTLYLSHKWIALAICRYYTRFLDTNQYGFGFDYNADKIRLLKIYIPLVILSTAIVYIISDIIKKFSNKTKEKK